MTHPPIKSIDDLLEGYENFLEGKVDSKNFLSKQETVQALYQRLANEAVHLSETDRMMMPVKTIKAVPLSVLKELMGIKE